jgi:small subunit ribosomal protein S21
VITQSINRRPSNFEKDKLLRRLTIPEGPSSFYSPFGGIFFNCKRGKSMPEVIVRKGEPVDRALKRLKNKLDAEGILEEVRRLRAFETPSQKVRRKAKANAKRGRTRFRFNPL